MSDVPPKVVFVDVDDTLVRSVGLKRIPMVAVIRRVRELHEAGSKLYCWSAGGAEYAKASAIEFGIGHCFVAFLPKPNLVIDDQQMHEWPQCHSIHPAEC